MFNNKIIPIFLWVLILQGCKNVEVIVEGNGRVYDVVGEENINCGSGTGEKKCTNSYGGSVDSVTFKAEADSGYRLKGWGNSCKGDVCSSTVLGGMPESLSVTFEKISAEISYNYNAGGQRVSKTVDGVTTFFIYQQNGLLLAELDSNGNTLVDYIYLEGKPVVQVRSRDSEFEETAYIHTDHIGSSKAATNQSGEVIWQIKTTPFGEVYSEAGTLSQYQRFPGQYADQESDYSYNYFRDYDPSTGRYIQSDPIGLGGGLNTFAYVYNNPLVYVDPTGEVGLLGSSGGAVLGAGSSLIGSVATGGWDALSNPETWAVAGASGLVGGVSGFYGDVTAGLRVTLLRSAALSGAANLAGQTTGLRTDNDQCNNLDYNYGSLAGSFVGGAWAGGITRGAGQISGAIIGWGPSTVSGTLGTALGK
jgi:RHS repeat-associated protein